MSTLGPTKPKRSEDLAFQQLETKFNSMKREYSYQPGATISNFDVKNIKFSKKYPMMDKIVEKEIKLNKMIVSHKDKHQQLSLPEIQSAVTKVAFKTNKKMKR